MTAPVVPEGAEPLGAWGPHTPGWVDANIKEKIAWAREHIDRADDALRAEFYATLDGPVALVRYYKRDADGCKYQAPVTGRAALEPRPVVVPLDELPPDRLLRPDAVHHEA